jgi:hypothetical protein
MWTSASRAPSKALIAFAALTGIAAGEPAFSGMWGAGDALLVIDSQGGRLQIGCTLVRFAPVNPDKDGRFAATAQVQQISLAPPVSAGEADDALPETAGKAATLAGQASGGTLNVTLTVEGQAPRALALTLGQRGTPARCL